MAPSVDSIPIQNLSLESKTLKADKGASISSQLRSFSSFDATPSIGTEFRAVSTDGKPTLSIQDVLRNEDHIKALGRLVSERGVVFFRDAVLTPDDQKTLVDKLGKAGGKPESSGLHVHPFTVEGSKLGDEISVISNEFVFSEKYKRPEDTLRNRPVGHTLWHSDITFEKVPSDYACLQIRSFPSVGGDTLWASAYEAYDRLSPPYQTFLEGLTAVHRGQGFLDMAKATNSIVRENRGSPENVGKDLEIVHPVIRTNPVTGWKGLFVNHGFTQKIVELTKAESDEVLDFLFRHISANHDLQVRFRWEENNLAIWDNRSTFHAATYDLTGDKREGTRAVSLGERPYLDTKSSGRRAALAAAAKA